MRLLARAEVDVEARIVAAVAVRVHAAVVLAVAVGDDVREAVEALLLRREPVREHDARLAPAEGRARRPRVRAAERLPRVVHARLRLARLAAGRAVAARRERGADGGGEGGGEDGELELHGGRSLPDDVVSSRTRTEEMCAVDVLGMCLTELKGL